MSVAECDLLTCVAIECNEDIRVASAIGKDDPSVGGKQKPPGIGDRPPSALAPRMPPTGGFGGKGPGIGEGLPATGGRKLDAG